MVLKLRCDAKLLVFHLEHLVLRFLFSWSLLQRKTASVLCWVVPKECFLDRRVCSFFWPFWKTFSISMLCIFFMLSGFLSSTMLFKSSSPNSLDGATSPCFFEIYTKAEAVSFICCIHFVFSSPTATIFFIC